MIWFSKCFQNHFCALSGRNNYILILLPIHMTKTHLQLLKMTLSLLSTLALRLFYASSANWKPTLKPDDFMLAKLDIGSTAGQWLKLILGCKSSALAAFRGFASKHEAEKLTWNTCIECDLKLSVANIQHWSICGMLSCRLLGGRVVEMLPSWYPSACQMQIPEKS